MDNVKAMRLGDGSERGPVDQPGRNVAGGFSPLIEYAAIALIILTCISLVYTAIVLASASNANPDVDIPGIDVNVPGILRDVRQKHFLFYVMTIVSYVSWSISMGCIGAIASIGMKAVKVPEIDEGFDISDNKSVFLRMVLGGLFALVLTVSFTSDCFFDLCYSIGTVVSPQARGEESLSVRAFILIVPFLLGFSTSLVMLIINQLNIGVIAFFGKLGPRPDAKTGSA